MNARIDLIDLNQPLPGQHEFISCWLSRADGLAFVVDPGPRSSAGQLVDELRARGVGRLDWILLTHIHLDHAGGTAQLAAAYPEARVVCHENGRGHLADPARLWEGSRAVLGHAAEVYGEPTPLGARRLASGGDLAGEEFARTGIQIVPTPGHSPHHICFLHGGTLFVGEAAGTTMALTGGGGASASGAGVPYLRPATPPRFHQGVALESLDRLLALDPPPARLAFGHYGTAENAAELLRVARRQLVDWVEVLRQERDKERQSPSAEPQGKALLGISPRLVARVHGRLLAEDPYYARWSDLEPDVQERELAFTHQTLAGMLGWLENPPGR